MRMAGTAGADFKLGFWIMLGVIAALIAVVIVTNWIGG
jgi:hypothetical protein